MTIFFYNCNCKLQLHGTIFHYTNNLSGGGEKGGTSGHETARRNFHERHPEQHFSRHFVLPRVPLGSLQPPPRTLACTRSASARGRTVHQRHQSHLASRLDPNSRRSFFGHFVSCRPLLVPRTGSGIASSQPGLASGAHRSRVEFILISFHFLVQSLII